jgi:hypothetical protein
MKTIQLIDRPPILAREALTNVLSNHSAKGITIGEMAACVKIISKLEAKTETLELEDAEYGVLIRYFEAFQFALAHPNLVALHEDLKGAAS